MDKTYFTTGRPGRQLANRERPSRDYRKPKTLDYRLLRRVLDNVDLNPLVDTLEAYHPTGRPGYDPRAMLRAVLGRLIVGERHVKQWADRIDREPVLKKIMGFGPDSPSESTFSRFWKRLTAHIDGFLVCLRQVIERMRAAVPKVKRVPGKPDEPLLPLGTVLAADSTLFPTFANPHSGCDPDAQWGYKNSAKSRDGKPILGYGYKMQLICDAVHEVPLAFTIHPADQNDYQTFPGALQQLAHAYPWLKPKYLLADKGYDSQKTHRILIRKRIIPIIDIRKPTANDALYEGIYGPNGSPVCLGNAEMEYVRTDPSTGKHLFRCGQDGCL